VGITADSIELIAEDVRRINCNKEGYLPGDPPVNKADIMEILKLCL
jgi:hypothetical protein